MMACQPCPPHLLTKKSKNACCPDCIPKGTVSVCDCVCICFLRYMCIVSIICLVWLFYRFPWLIDTRHTVCFFSFVIFYDDVILKVVEIIDFRKSFQRYGRCILYFSIARTFLQKANLLNLFGTRCRHIQIISLQKLVNWTIYL